MIYVDITGRLGNQMFQYAFAKLLSLRTGHNITIGTSILCKFKWELEILNFCIDEVILDSRSRRLIFLETSFKQKVLLYPLFFFSNFLYRKNIDKKINFQRKYQASLNLNGIYYIQNGLESLDISLSDSYFVYGHFENPWLFDESFRSILIRLFTPKCPPLSKNTVFYDNISKSNSVCVTIRRGDYFSNSNYEKVYGICDGKYYKKAIDFLCSTLLNPKFFIFSDDIEWVKKNIEFPKDSYFEDGNDPIWEKLRLMYSCKHFVISNSTFSWWAQYLSRNPEKIVVSPAKWRLDSDYAFLLDNSFVKIL